MKRMLSLLLVFVIVVSCIGISANAAGNQPTPPKMQSVIKVNANTFRLNWSKPANVTGYILYCKAGNASYQRLKVLGKDTTTFLHRNLNYATKYSYVIKSYRKVNNTTSYSKNSNIVSKTCIEPLTEVKPVISAVSAYNSTSNKITWKNTARAQGYILYCAVNNNSYKRIANVKATVTSYLHKGTSTSNHYSYVVKAYRKTNNKIYYSKNSNIVTKYAYEPLNSVTPTIKSISLSDIDSIKLTWKPEARASGYVLFFSTDGEKFKILKWFDKNTLSFTHTNLKNNVKYFYKVRAYRNVNGTKMYSKYSNMVGKKTTNFLMNLYQPYSTAFQGYSDYTSPKTVQMGGKSYTNGFGLDPTGYAYFNLGGKYNKITFTAGVRDGASHDCAFSVIADDSVVKIINLKANDLPKNYTVYIDKASKLQFQGTDGWFWNDTTIVNIKLYK